MPFQAAVHVRDGLFVFEVVHITDTPDDVVGSDAAATVHRKSLINNCFYSRLVLEYLFKPLQPLLVGKHRHLADVGPYADKQLVEQGEGSLDDIQVAERDRIKGSGE